MNSGYFVEFFFFRKRTFIEIKIDVSLLEFEKFSTFFQEQT